MHPLARRPVFLLVGRAGCWRVYFEGYYYNRPSPTAPPSVKQIYAIAHGLCERYGERWPESKAEASALIRVLRGEDEPG